MNDKKKIVIIGAGMACGKLVEEIVQRKSANFDITVIGEEKGGVYNRVKLINLLKSDESPDFWTHSEPWFRDNGVRGVFGTPAVHIDKEKRLVRLADNTVYPYDTLVLATGAVPFIPPVKGSELPGVFAIRNIEDVEIAQDYLKDKSEVLVIGGGLLGLELALALKTMGKHVTVSHLVGHLMEFQLCRDAGLILQKKLEGKGFDFIMNNSVTDLIGGGEGVKTAQFKSGRTLPVQGVFFNTGIRANAALAKEMDVRVNKGIVVDDGMRTEFPDIYAIGECCEHRGIVYGLVAPVWDQARVLAGILCGENLFYEGSSIPPTRLKSDFPVITMGRFNEEPGDDVITYEDPGSNIYKKLIVRKGRLVGANLVGDDLNVDAISIHYTAKIPVPDKRTEVLFPGTGAGGEIMVDANQWPDDATICDCNGISAGKIRNAIHAGNDTLTKVMNSTRAGTGCGNCKGKLKSLLISIVGELKEDPAEKYFVPGIPLNREDLTDLIVKKGYRAVSEVLAHDKSFIGDAKTKMGLDFLLNYIYKGDYKVEYEAKPANDRYFGNIQKDGKFSVIPRVHGGKMDLPLLKRIAEAAEKYNLTVKITGADRIGLYSIDKQHLDGVWKILDADCGYAYTKTFRAAKSCVGTEFCRFGLGDSLTLGVEMDERYHGMTGPAKFKMGASGCPRNCAEATIKDFGVVAVDNGWDIYIGGNGGAQVTAGKKLTRVKTHAEVLKVCDRYYEYYRRNGKYLERTAPFVERIGLETIKDAILYNTEDKLSELDRDFQKALDSIVNPWENPPSLDNESAGKVLKAKGKELHLCRTDELAPGKSRVFRTDGAEIALFHLIDGKWLATSARCPHENGPIVDSIYGAGRLNCPIHNNSFDIITGVCTNPEVANLKIYMVRVDNGEVSVALD
ncbi:MAG: hypothetical protein A2Y33_02420 [Spirochaetes bacterium GWF1_51_8]|nr:MAG: hypothetical protein A2Y33_02420 [Spirochaetes bacterium GWF1_51_8]